MLDQVETERGCREVAADKLSISYKDYPVTLCCFQRTKSYGQASQSSQWLSMFYFQLSSISNSRRAPGSWGAGGTGREGEKPADHFYYSHFPYLAGFLLKITLM